MTSTDAVIRLCSGAGRWYPGTKTALSDMVRGFLQDAISPPVTRPILSALAPHAGYVYSGPVAGETFRAIERQMQRGREVDTFVVLGFSHRGPGEGICLMDGDYFRTPLGLSSLDKECLAFFKTHAPRVRADAAPHMAEHSAENLIPFIQSIAPQAALVVALVGHIDKSELENFCKALEMQSQEKSIMVVASTDMLHDPDYDLVTRTDRNTLEMLSNMDLAGLEQAWRYDQQILCGIQPAKVAMRYAQLKGARQGEVLRYRNSGDDHPESRGQWVVGYGSVVFTGDP